MRNFINIAISFIAGLFLMSCVSHADGKIKERDISLKLVTNLEDTIVFINPAKKLKQIKPISGIYHFETPALRFHTPKIMGVSLNDNIWDIPDFLIVKHGSNVVSVLSCQQIWDLEKDTDGNSILEINLK
jgi:hypothetical protein